MRQIKVTVGPLQGASANNIALSQTTAGAAALTINGSLASAGVATLDKPRQVLITNGGNDSGITFKVVGTTFANAPVSETVTGTNASTVATATDFATVTSIATSGATSGSGVTVGTNGVAGSSWVKLDEFGLAGIFLGTVKSGTVNYTVQATQDNPNGMTGNAVTIPNVTWDSTLPGIVNATANTQVTMTSVPEFVRVLLNSGSGSLTLAVGQPGTVPF